MRRRSNWRQSLVEYLGAMASQEFEPGRLDCALFAAGAVEAMTGEDAASDHRGTYETLEEGILALRRQGLRDHIDMASRLLSEIPVALAQVGDLAVVSAPEGDALGVVQGAKIYFVSPKRGLDLVDLMQAKRAFRVPF